MTELSYGNFGVFLRLVSQALLTKWPSRTFVRPLIKNTLFSPILKIRAFIFMIDVGMDELKPFCQHRGEA